MRVLIGEAFGRRSPVATRSPTLYLDIALRRRRGAAAAAGRRARAVFGGRAVHAGRRSRCRRSSWWCCTPGEQPLLRGRRCGARVVLIGGQPLGRRFMVWNFVSSRKERIVQAQDDWRAQRFDPVPGETEFIPLP